MSCVLPLSLIRRRFSHLLLGVALLMPPVPPPTIAAEETGATASLTPLRDRRSSIRSDAPSRPDTLPPPAPEPHFPPPSHLSGASLLFVIWLVAEQVSADLGDLDDRVEPHGPSQSLP